MMKLWGGSYRKCNCFAFVNQLTVHIICRHVSFFYYHLYKDTVETIMPAYVEHWEKYTERAIAKERWRAKRIIAFPVHSKLPEHWTLAIAVNTSYQAENPPIRSIKLFHFDSFPCDSGSRAKAEKFTRFALNLSDGEELAVYEVPVPYQPTYSSDCGLYPAHFLKIFLNNADKAIDFCQKVSSHEHTSLNHC
jgi:Ulp1 family protease